MENTSVEIDNMESTADMNVEGADMGMVEASTEMTVETGMVGDEEPVAEENVEDNTEPSFMQKYKVLIIILVLLLLVGGGYFAYTKLSKKSIPNYV